MNQYSFPSVLICCILAFFLFSSEECKDKSSKDEQPAKTEQISPQEDPKQPEHSTPPKDIKPPVPDTTKPVNIDTTCVKITDIKHKFPCPDLYDPVCGCDGKNYPNPCSAERAGVLKWEKGRCN